MPGLFNFNKPIRSSLVEAILVFGFLIAVYGQGISSLPIHRDEKEWIAASGFFEAITHLQFQDKIWIEHHWTLEEPPVARYIIGIGRSLGGFPISSLSIPADYHQPGAAVFPSPDIDAQVLWWSRLPMAFLAASSGLMMFWLLSLEWGRLAGWSFALIFGFNSYFVQQLGRAMSEAPLLFLTCLSMLASYALLRKFLADLRGDRGTWGWIVIGFLAGLAGSSKLNGIFTALTSFPFLAFSFIRNRGLIPWKSGVRAAIRGTTIPILMAGVVFVLVNPYLYPDPIYRSVKLFKYRAAEIAWQQTVFAESSMPAALDQHIAIVIQRIFKNYAVFHNPTWEAINILFCLTGFWLVIRSVRSWISGKSEQFSGLIVLIFGGVMAAPLLLTPLDWDRYFLLPIFFGGILFAIGSGCALQILYKFVLSIER